MSTLDIFLDNLIKNMHGKKGKFRKKRDRIMTVQEDKGMQKDNDRCPRGSGKKYKNCCGRNQ